MTEPISPDDLAEDDEAASDAPADAGDDTAAETPAEDQAPPDEPQETPEALGTTPEEWEQRFTKAERAFATYTRKISDLWGDDATHLAPFSLDAGAPPGFIDVRNAGRVDDETKATALAFLGFAREQDYEPDPESRLCETCKGKGFTKRASLVAGKDKRVCPECKGEGDIGVRNVTAATGPNGHSEEPFTLAEHAGADAPERDNWGEPRILPDGRENPNYGRQPQYKILVEPFGVTAQLGVQDVVPGA